MIFSLRSQCRAFIDEPVAQLTASFRKGREGNQNSDKNSSLVLSSTKHQQSIFEETCTTNREINELGIVHAGGTFFPIYTVHYPNPTKFTLLRNCYR